VKALFEIFRLEFRALVRSRALAIMALASVAWMFAAPYVFRADGTAAGARELCIRFSLGGVAALLAVTLLISAAGALSRERTAKRLQLTMVRPVRLVAIALGKMVALSIAGALVLALAAVVEVVRQDPARTCNGVYRPILPSPEEEAERMYEAFMRDPDTPPAVKHAKRSVVLRLLAQRALDHYQAIGTNATVRWNFSPAAFATPQAAPRALRFHFTNLYNMRDAVRGSVWTCGACGTVSNITQAIVTVPLAACAPSDASPRLAPGEVRFENRSPRPVMLRPRRDIELLVAADGFLANLLRAYLELVGMLTLLVAFGVFLGAGLSRPVAVFVAVVTLALSEMSPSVIEQYPDELETNRIDAIGLSLARFSATVTRPVGALRPIASLAADDRVEPREVAWTLLADVVVLPFVLALLAALVLPRKQDEL